MGNGKERGRKGGGEGRKKGGEKEGTLSFLFCRNLFPRSAVRIVRRGPAPVGPGAEQGRKEGEGKKEKEEGEGREKVFYRFHFVALGVANRGEG